MNRQEIMNEIRKETGSCHFVRNYSDNVSDADRNTRRDSALEKAAYDLATDIAFARFHFRSLSTLNYA